MVSEGSECHPERREEGLAANRSSRTVSAVIINYNGAAFLKGCLASLLTQSHPVAELLVVDNRSADDSVSIVRETFPTVRLIELPRNVGYAGAANVAFRETRSRYLLLLNPDVVLTPTFLEELLGFAETRPVAGSLAGKLLRSPQRPGPPIIDSTGHVLFRNRWAVNRGEDEEDRGQYDEVDEVFGVSGAAPLYRRAMLEDIRVDDEVFAESFFLYLEDVDVDWRARLRGWKAFYVPSAVGYHERGQKAGHRPRDAAILRHSLKNRYLMMIRNEAVSDLLIDGWAIFPTDVLRTLDFLFTAPRSLAGYLDVVRLLPGTVRQRRQIRERMCVPPGEVRRWLRHNPVRGRAMARVRLLLSRSAPS
jgi:GT2 family glycosyltransferase